MRSRFRGAPAFGLTLLMLLGFPGVVNADHDGTCHPPVSTGMLLAVKTADSDPQELGFSASVIIEIGTDGNPSAHGTVRVEAGDLVRTFLADGDSATTGCSIGDGELLRVELALHELASADRAVLTIRPGVRSDGPWRTASLSLVTSDTGTLIVDGAILVVSAADGPMP